jgi:hypothetical protein
MKKDFCNSIRTKTGITGDTKPSQEGGGAKSALGDSHASEDYTN